MFERFTDGARRVVVFSQEEARLLNHNFIGTEHLLLGILREEENVGAEALRSSGVSLEAARSKVEEIVGRHDMPPGGHIPFTPRAKKVMELGMRESMQLHRNYIDPGHLLLGLIREGEGVGAQVLVQLGADLSTLRVSVLEAPHMKGPMPGREAHLSVRAAATAEAVARPLADAPWCPWCGSSLVATAGYRVIDATAESSMDDPVPFNVLYCKSCGNALGTAS